MGGPRHCRWAPRPKRERVESFHFRALLNFKEERTEAGSQSVLWVFALPLNDETDSAELYMRDCATENSGNRG